MNTKPSVRGAILAALMLVSLVALYMSGIDHKLDQSVPERIRYYAIPVVVSADRYGLPGYVAYPEIQQRFANNSPIDRILSEELPGALTDGVFDAAARGEGLFLVPADDKGNITFTRFAFQLFGSRVVSLYRMYFVLLGLSVLAFAVTFRGEPAPMFVGVCTLLSLLSVVSAFREGLFLPYAVTLYDPRIFGVGAVLAVLHLGFAATTATAMSPVRWLCLGYQAWLVVFAVHVRFDNVWMVMAVTAWLAAHACWHRRSMTRAVLVRLAMPTIVLVAGLGALLAWERVAYHPRYFTSHMAHHLVWHNMGLGFVLHPEFARTFPFPASDQAMMDRTARRLLEQGQPAAVAEVFGAAYSNSSGTPAGATISVGEFLHSDQSDLARYDRYARDVVFSMVREHPGQALALYLYYKPRYVLAMVSWFMGLSASKPALLEDGRQTPLFCGGDPAPRAPLSVTQFLVLAAALLAVVSPRPLLAGSTMFATTALLAFSTLPLVLAYAAPFLMAATVLAASLAVFVAIGVVFSRIASARGAGRGQL